MAQDTFSVVYVGLEKENNELFKRVFKNVNIATTQKEAMMFIMTRREKTNPILFLIDIDHHYNLFEKICQSIYFDDSINIIPVVCSQNDSASAMIQSIQIGAKDYILKPLREPVLKTMFLNIYRHKVQNKITTPHTNIKANTILSQFQSRLDCISRENHWLLETSIAHQYTPNTTQQRVSIDSMSSERKAFLDKYICEWHFSPLHLEENDLIHCVFTMLDQAFDQLPEINSFRMKDQIMYDFIFDVCNSYHNSNPYHNFKHAVDVMQSTWYFLSSMGALKSTHKSKVERKSPLRPIDILALLMASLGHDVGHPGVNNGFMINTATTLAILYNDKSVLESYHSMTFFDLLCKYFSFANIDLKSHSEYKEFRRVLVHCILCTDMGCHGEYLQTIKETRPEDDKKLVLCTAIMKCADISNCTRPFDIAKDWAILLADEFSKQGDLEKELGIPSIPINERGKVPLPDFQLYFMNNIAKDLYMAVENLVPELDFCVENIRENCTTWEEKKKLL